MLLYTLPLDGGDINKKVISSLCENATGRSLPEVIDPTDFGDIELEEKRIENTAIERLLAEIYPTIAKVNSTWTDRLKEGANLIDFMDDVNVLFRIPMPGVPRVYSDTISEMKRRLQSLRKSDLTTVERFASKIFFRKPSDSMTSLGNLLATICSGLWVSPPQTYSTQTFLRIVCQGWRAGDG